MVHLDVKKAGRIPDGGGWRAHGRDSAAAKASKRGSGTKVGYIYLHSAVDGFSRLAYTEALADERATTTIGFFCRARAFFAAHGIQGCTGWSPTTAPTIGQRTSPAPSPRWRGSFPRPTVRGSAAVGSTTICRPAQG